MSGTSLDGVDVARAKFSWDFEKNRLNCSDIDVYTVAMPLAIRTQVLALQTDGAGNSGTLKELTDLHQTLGKLFASAVEEALTAWQLANADVLCVGSHGQTVYHQPPTIDASGANQAGVTLQLGDLAVMAAQLNLPIIGDFRLRDMAVGGQGAPLVPFFDTLFFTETGQIKCLQNMGGIGNVTVLNGFDVDPIAFDTGSGNMLIDGAMMALFNKPYDENGETAKKGTLIPALLERLKEHPFLGQQPPKSTGREAWGTVYFQPLIDEFLPNHQPEDLIATFTAFTAWSLVDAYERYVLPTVSRIDEILISGGGAYNPSLIYWVQYWINQSSAFGENGGMPRFSSCEAYGLPNMAKEAVAFALLAWARYFGLPNNLPSCTGASGYVSMGHWVV
jgi:anhydro-N-acetylmuramic acid kinase